MNQFPGWEPPLENWSKLPHAFISMLPDLTFAELKVTLYILRHTWGFDNYSGYVSMTVDEIRFGRNVKDGKRLDNGTGLSKQSVLTGLTKALQRGTLEVAIDTSDRARMRKSYRLRGQNILPRSKNLTSGVQNLDLELNKDNLKEKDPSPKVKKKTRRAEFNEEMEAKFSSCASIRLPVRRTVNQQRAAGSLWNTPLWELYTLFRPDEERSGETKLMYEEESLRSTLNLIERAVEKMRLDNLTISTPKSIVQVAVSVFSQETGVVTDQSFWDQFK